MKNFIIPVILVLCSSFLFGASIEILPALVSFDFIPPGYTFNMEAKTGTPILVPNNNDAKLQFSVSFSAQKAPNSLLPGYTNFPDVSWCHIEPDTDIWVAAHDTGRVNLFFRIPDDPKYLNQYWELGVVVAGKQGIKTKSGGVSMGIIPSVMGSYLISTLPNPKAQPADRLTSIVPSAAFLKTDEAIKGKDLTFSIYNNDTVPHDYVIKPYEFPHFEWYDVRLSIQFLGEHKEGKLSWLKTSHGFLFFKKNTVHLEPGQSAQWTVSVKLPNNKEVKEAPGWDLVVKILPDNSKENSGIFRISIDND